MELHGSILRRYNRFSGRVGRAGVHASMVIWLGIVRTRWRRGSTALLTSVLLASSTSTAAENDIQLWPVVTVNHAFNDRWGAHLATRVRVDADVSEAKDYLIRPFVTWRPHEKLVLDLGYDYLHSFQSSTEHRIWQAVEHSLSWRGILLKNRIRIDERFIEGVDGVVARFRYRLRGTHPIADSAWYGVISDEVLANMNEQDSGPGAGFEQNRLRFALGIRFLERLHLETGYEWQTLASRSGAISYAHVFVVEFSLDTSARPGYLWSPR